MWRLDRRHWSLLAALDLDGSLTAAAEGLGITQSAASQRLREAERRMGVPLIVRRGRGVMLNAAGARLATAGAALEASLSTAEADALWVGRRRRPRLRLAQDHHDSPSVAAAVARICAGCGVDLEIVRCAAADVASRLLSGDADAAVLPHEAELPGIAAEPLFDDRLVAVAPRGSSLAEIEAAAPEDFAGHRYLTYGLFPRPGWEYESFFRSGAAFPAEIQRIESTATICALVADGAGLSILPERAVPAALARVPLMGQPITVEWYLHRADAERRHRPDAVAAAGTAILDGMARETAC